MGVFESRKSFPGVSIDLTKLTACVEDHFKAAGFEIKTEMTLTGVLVSIRKGNIFKSVLGMNMALNIDIDKSPSGITARAHVGVFGSQVIPTFLALFVLWPVLISQIWGLIQQSKLDDEALQVISDAVAQIGESTSQFKSGQLDSTLDRESKKAFCTQCGKAIPAQGKFCAFCGVEIAVVEM